MKGKAKHRIPSKSRRWRVLLVLLVFSLAPLLAVTILCQRGASRLRMSILSLVDASLTEIVGKELQQTAENYARVLNAKLGILHPDRTASGTTSCLFGSEHFDSPG